MEEFGQDKSWKSDGASPYDPAHSLLLLRRKRATAFEQNQEDGGVDGKASEERDLGDPLGWKAEHVEKAQKREHENRDGEEWHGPLRFSPTGFGAVIGEAQRKYHEAGESSALGQGLCELLNQNNKRPALQQRVIREGLARVYPDHVKEQSPGHPAGASPNQPECNDDDYSADERIG